MKTNSLKLLTLSLLCVFSTSVFLAGCGSEEFVDTRDKVPVVPVTGKIMVNGSTLAIPKTAKIVMHPDDETKDTMPNDIRSPSAWLEADGSTFIIGSYTSSDGAPVGKYKLTIEVGQRSLMNGAFRGGELGGKYGDPEASEIEVVVTGDEGSIDLGTFELTGSPGEAKSAPQLGGGDDN